MLSADAAGHAPVWRVGDPIAGHDEVLRFRQNAGGQEAAWAHGNSCIVRRRTALHPDRVVGGLFKAAGRRKQRSRRIRTTLRPAPTRYPPGTCRVVSGSQVASSGQATSTATISTMIRNIGRAVLAM